MRVVVVVACDCVIAEQRIDRKLKNDGRGRILTLTCTTFRRGTCDTQIRVMSQCATNGKVPISYQNSGALRFTDCLIRNHWTIVTAYQKLKFLSFKMLIQDMCCSAFGFHLPAVVSEKRTIGVAVLRPSIVVDERIAMLTLTVEVR